MARNNYTTDHARRLGFRSGFEADVAKELEALNIRYFYEDPNHCAFTYTKNVIKGRCQDCGSDEVFSNHTYTCDFCISVDGCPYMYIETKGRFTASDRAKMEQVLKANPYRDIRILFQYDGKATPKRSYTEWCAWKGIKCAVIDRRNKRYIPKEWLEELGVTDK